jgi:sulfur carrier protein ThiS
VNVRVEMSRTRDTRDVTLGTVATVEDLLISINLKPDTVIVMRKAIPIPIDHDLKDGDELKIIEVTSGG